MMGTAVRFRQRQISGRTPHCPVPPRPPPAPLWRGSSFWVDKSLAANDTGGVPQTWRVTGMSSIFTVHRQPYGEVMNPISPDSVRFHDKNGNVTEVRMVDGMVNIHVGGVTVSAEHLEDLIRQMFGRGEHPPAEAQPCGCGEATCTVPWEPGCGLGKSEQHVEAQPVAWLGANPRTGVPVMAVRTPAPSVMRDFAMRPLYAHPPPSAPVGVEAVLRDALQGLIDFIEIDNLPMDADAMFIAKRALAQQPAADNRICSVCDGGPGNDGPCLCGERRWEQPAAVEGLLTCYQCGKTVTWLAPDSRCGDCTRLTPDEVRGQ